MMTRLFAFNSGTTLSGTTQVGNIAVGGYLGQGDLQWWSGPDENDRYIICVPVPSGDQPTPFGNIAYIGFNGTEDKSDDSYKNLINIMSNQNFPSSLSAKTWIDNNNYWSSHWTSQMITDQLVLYYDASDLTSFKGEPTTNLITNPTNEVISNNSEFIRYTNIAPIFDTYGYGNDITYSLSLDLKSSNINNNNKMTVYMQNGSGSKYSFVYASVPVTTSYQRFSFNNIHAVLSNTGLTESWLAFYGTYGTGNYPSIKNVQIEIKNHATPFVVGNRGTTYATGGGWCDLSGNENHGTLNYTESIENTGYLQNSDNTSNFFAISIPDSTILNDTFTKTTGGWTIEEIIWTNSCTYPEADAGTVVSNNGFSTGSGFDWNHGMNTSTFRFEQVSNSINVDNNSISVPSPYNSYNSWRVRTMIWDRTNNKNYLYINGDYIGFVNTPNTTGLSIYDGGGISLGTLYGWKHYGRRASFKIYNKILSADEIQQNFNIVKTKFGL